MSQLILQRVREQMIDSMTELALTRDNETGLHIQRTKLYVKTLAQASPGGESYREQLSDEQIEKITAAAPLHDLGKVGIPDHILLKPSRHTADEMVIMRTHAMLGETILALAGVYDALTTECIYKKAWTHEAASAEIYRLSGKKFDPDLVFAFGQAEARFREIAIELSDATATSQP